MLWVGGKISPGVNRDHFATTASEKVETLDFFVVDDLGGTNISTMFASSFTNEPPISIGIKSAPSAMAVGLVAAKVFGRADSQPGVRQLYHLAEQGLADKDAAVYPFAYSSDGGDYGKKQSTTTFA